MKKYVLSVDKNRPIELEITNILEFNKTEVVSTS